MAEKVQDCRSVEGQSTGLVDAVIFVVRAVMEEGRDRSHEETQKAMVDLYQDKVFHAFLAECAGANAAYVATQQEAIEQGLV